MTTNLIVRLNNFSLWKVSTSKAKTTPKEFMSSHCQKYPLPDDMNAIHFEYTQFYYPGDMDFPLPPPKLFAYFNPIQLTLDPLTVLWMNAFALNLQRSVKLLSVEQAEPPYLDVKVEARMFRFVYFFTYLFIYFAQKQWRMFTDVAKKFSDFKIMFC